MILDWNKDRLLDAKVWLDGKIVRYVDRIDTIKMRVRVVLRDGQGPKMIGDEIARKVIGAKYLLVEFADGTRIVAGELAPIQLNEKRELLLYARQVQNSNEDCG